MNVLDIKSEKPEGDMLELIFEKQKSLMEKYHHIEKKQRVGYGILGDRKFDLNEIKSQCLLKDFAWRVTEEIAEAEECTLPKETEHFFEELIDALHFLTELCIIVGLTAEDISIGKENNIDLLTWLCLNNSREKYINAYDCVQSLGLAMNCLKQKPWKQTHILTDTVKFLNYIIEAYHLLIAYINRMGLSAEEIYDFYFKKNKVNEFRQKSNY